MGLSLNNLCIGNVLLKINECKSTNNYAKNLLSKNEPIDGTVVVTDKQTNGKGQYGNKWEAQENKNLTFSIILKPKFLTVDKQFYISKIISLACVDVLNSFKKNAFKIKWPNDIYYRNKKIGGILIENSISSKIITSSIVGVGLNINQIFFNKDYNAISLKNILEKDFELKEILKALLKNLDVYYLMLKNNKLELIDEKYFEHFLKHQKRQTFKISGTSEKFIATIKGVNQIGQLLLFKDNQIVNYNFKEVEWVF